MEDVVDACLTQSDATAGDDDLRRKPDKDDALRSGVEALEDIIALPDEYLDLYLNVGKVSPNAWMILDWMTATRAMPLTCLACTALSRTVSRICVWTTKIIFRICFRTTGIICEICSWTRTGVIFWICRTTGTLFWMIEILR